jgi:hypothetical protein
MTAVTLSKYTLHFVGGSEIMYNNWDDVDVLEGEQVGINHDYQIKGYC